MTNVGFSLLTILSCSAQMSSELNNEDQSLQNWPSKDFLETALRNWLENPKVNVTEFTSRIATNKGDNCTSQMYRVVIKCENRKDPLTIIIKRVKLTGSSANTTMNSTSFAREVQMLRTVLPEMHAVLKKVIPDVEPFGAGYVYSTYGVLAMEDLQQGGFRMAERRFGLDLNHCSLVLRTLARFHAASVLVMEQNSLDISIYKKCVLGEQSFRAEVESFLPNMLKTLSDELKTFSGLNKYSAKFSAFADQDFLSTLLKLLEEQENGDFVVVSHLDLWTNNLLFRYSSSGEPNGVRFVDFQTTSISNPCVDLQYFLTTSCNETVRTTSIDQLLEEYHETLCKTMAALKCSTRPPTLDNLKMDFDKCTHIGMLAAFTVLPMVLEDAELFDFNEVVETGQLQNALFRGQPYRKALEWFLPLYESKGFL